MASRAHYVMIGGFLGAGKTTALHYLAGLVHATAGAASAFGLPLAEFRHTHRRDVGFCPQQNVLWEELTCADHVRLFARLKGATATRAEA